jgi:hypothetical protein
VLSKIGKMMTEFPLSPRQSRIIVEAILKYPGVTQETIIAAAFLSTQSPYILPPGEETDARHAHHGFRDKAGDFVSYLKIFRSYSGALDREGFCKRSYLDEKAMAEIANVVEQLELIVSKMGVPLLSGGKTDDYLCAIGRGLIQFVCVRSGRDLYHSLTAERILIHPGSVMFRENPEYIVAGEIVRTARMYASSVSPLSHSLIEKIAEGSHAGDVVRRLKPLKALKPLKGKPQDEPEPQKLRWRDKSFDAATELDALVAALPLLGGKTERPKGKRKGESKGEHNRALPAAGYLCMTGSGGRYQIRSVRRFNTALNESIAALEALIDDLGADLDLNLKNVINSNYRRLTEMLGN